MDPKTGMTESIRMLALDVGDKRIGVAACDALGMLVSPIEAIHRKNTKSDVAQIARLATENEATALVVGLPKNMDGTEGNQAAKVRSFAEALERETGLTVHFEDERLSTFTAIERLVERGIKTGQNRDLVDMESAVVILESFLARRQR
jgi:putative Holliday junction resolvase